ncbi:hypothetical protein [Paraprevotella clara]
MVLDVDDGYRDEYYNVTVTATKLTWTYNNGYDVVKKQFGQDNNSKSL